MKATILIYDTGGTEKKPRRQEEAHIAWAENPPVLSLEIQLSPDRFMGVQIPVSELKAALAQCAQA